jgi:nicotinate phosphoribosyltransferase
MTMPVIDRNTGLYTDHYELVMAQGYFQSGMRDMPAVFDFFFRNNPYEAGKSSSISGYKKE